ncbi:MAG: hypothetical protein ACK41O_26880 [Runella zeae]
MPPIPFSDDVLLTNSHPSIVCMCVCVCVCVCVCLCVCASEASE